MMEVGTETSKESGVEKVLAQRGELSLAELLLCKVRYLMSSPVRKSVILTGLIFGCSTGGLSARPLYRSGPSFGNFCLRW